MKYTDIYKRIFPIHRRIIFQVMLPVVISGVFTTILLSTYFSRPLDRFMREQFDANLRLASRMGINICETYYQQILDFRLEENVEINRSYKTEALQEIRAISRQFPNVEMMVIKNRETVLAASTDLDLKKWPLPDHAPGEDSILNARLSNNSIKSNIRYFPFWDWYIVSYISDKNYRAPIISANRLILFSTLGVFLIVFIVLMIVFNRSLLKPLNRLIVATKNVSEGKMIPVAPVQENEIGQLIQFFNEMIENLKTKEDRITKSLHEKEILLKEIHHRVKNNLQIVNSLIALQSDNISDPHTLNHLRDIEGRIKTMGIIHEQLYRSSDFSHIFLDDYLRELVGHLFLSYMMDPERIHYEIQGDHFEIDLIPSIPCGLILNEIVSNAFKYAFPGSRTGNLFIEITRTNGGCTITVSDDGVGFPEGVDLREGGRLGMQLIASLVKQLNGTVDMKRNNGTEYIIAFPLGGSK